MSRWGRWAAARAAAGELRVEARAQRLRRRQLLLAVAGAVAALVEYERRHGRELDGLAARIDGHLGTEKDQG